MSVFKKVSNIGKILAIGVLIGQYGQPIPLEWKSGLPFVMPSVAANFDDSDFGYTKEERSAMDALVKDALPNG